MSADGPQHSRAADRPTGLAAGTLLVLGAEALAFPAGLLVTILLTRHLSAAEYGALALALAGVAWIEWTVVTLFSRASWKLIAEADDWRPVAMAVVRAFALASIAVAVIVFVTAGWAAELLGVPALERLLQVFAFEIPIFVLAQAYRTVLIGRGLHQSRAAVAAVRWTVRALLVATGALLGAPLVTIAVLIVAATAVELAVARWRALADGHHTPRRDDGRAPGPEANLTIRRLVVYAAPLALSAICMRLFDRIDIFALRLLGGSIESVAAYGVAQNLALAPALFGTALTPALVAALSVHFARGDGPGARLLGGKALRVGFLMVPATLFAAGAAPALIDLMFGVRYVDAGPVFALARDWCRRYAVDRARQWRARGRRTSPLDPDPDGAPSPDCGGRSPVGDPAGRRARCGVGNGRDGIGRGGGGLRDCARAGRSARSSGHVGARSGARDSRRLAGEGVAGERHRHRAGACADCAPPCRHDGAVRRAARR